MGMAGDEDGDGYFDSDFDDISNDALAELEITAIRLTQAQPQRPAEPAVAPSSDYGDDFEPEDLDDAVLIDESRSTPAINPRLDARRTTPQIQRDSFISQRFSPNDGLANRQRQNTSLPPRFCDPPQVLPDEPVAQLIDSAGPHSSLDSLQRLVEELTRERNALKEDVNSKAGEIAIVRSKQEKTAKEFERELAALRKFNDEKLAKGKKDLEAARMAEMKAATERDFYKQDAEEAARAHRLNKARASGKKDEAINVTPKKKKIFSHRDGFDDDEIELLSPSKLSPSKLRRATSSPSNQGKRKRKAAESPVGKLEVIQPEEPQAQKFQQPVLDEAILNRLAIQDDRFDFLGTILDHRVDSNHLRTIEELGKYTLPGNTESFQSIILGKIPTLGYRKAAADLPIEFCEVLMSLWSDCMQAQWLEPVNLLAAMLKFAIELKTTSIAPQIIDTLVPLVRLTVTDLLIHRFSHKEIPKYFSPVDTTGCLSLLYITALGCMCEPEYIVRFWKLMCYDAILVSFGVEQRLADTELMLSLLSTSIFKDSFGARSANPAEEVIIDKQIGDHFSRILTKIPTKPDTKGREPLESEAVDRLRLMVLQLMTGMTRSPYAGSLIVKHQNAIGAIVSLISNELDDLYDYKPRRRESARIISLATRLLYHLVTKYEDSIDIQKKLATVEGGNHKYLLSLARLSFSEEDLVLESEIDPDVATCALELLEMSVTPEEGDAIHSAFSSQ